MKNLQEELQPDAEALSRSIEALEQRVVEEAYQRLCDEEMLIQEVKAILNSCFYSRSINMRAKDRIKKEIHGMHMGRGRSKEKLIALKKEIQQIATEEERREKKLLESMCKNFTDIDRAQYEQLLCSSVFLGYISSTVKNR